MGWQGKKLTGGFGHLAFALGCGHIGGRWSLGSLIWMKGLRLGPDTLWLTPRGGLHPRQGYPLGITHRSVEMNL